MLHFFPGSTAQADRDTFDYLYRSEDLKFFRGKKLSGQRNHVNRFHKTYGTWTFRPIVPEDLPMILALLDRYVQEHEKDSVSYLEDLNKTKEVLNNLDLYDMKGGLLMVEDRLAGFSLGEVLGDTPVHPTSRRRTGRSLVPIRCWSASLPRPMPGRGSPS